MTPKEKANELLDNYWLMNNVNPCLSKEQSKQCALILVDELLNYQLILLEYFPSKNYQPTYWQEFKNEIELL